MNVIVEFAEYLANKVGERKTAVTMTEGSCIRDLINLLIQNYGKAVEDLFFVDEGKLLAVFYVNKQYQQQDYVLHDNDHVVFFMPLAGG